MSDISKAFRDVLKEKYCLIKPSIFYKQVASDGTIKLLLEMEDGSKVETVLMRYNYGNVVCVTSQVGCNMGCSFCASGLLKKQRDLMPYEMVGQIFLAYTTLGLTLVISSLLMGKRDDVRGIHDILADTKVIDITSK